LSDDDDASSSSPDSSPADSTQRSKGSGTSGSGQKRQDSAFQEPESSKEWMFYSTAALQYAVATVCPLMIDGPQSAIFGKKAASSCLEEAG
jgi:hypothetical protein